MGSYTNFRLDLRSVFSIISRFRQVFVRPISSGHLKTQTEPHGITIGIKVFVIYSVDLSQDTPVAMGTNETGVLLVLRVNERFLIDEL